MTPALEELVGRLRKDTRQGWYGCQNCDDTLKDEAADAIEALSADKARLEEATLAAVDAAIRKFKTYTDTPNIEAVIIAARGAVCDTFAALALNGGGGGE